ncbi:MAG: YbjQ family protein [Planctomycetota bacterium]|jgi:uncharacterized protein YbjQ (UPF0145 family)
MIITTTDNLPGYKITETIGLVRGSAIRTRHVFADISEWFRNLVGAELHHYTKMMGETREQALDRMRDHARQLGADAIVGLTLNTSNIAGGAAEMLALGTAVKIEAEPET